MEPHLWYAIALLGIIVLLVLRRARSKLISIGQRIATHIGHRILVSRGSWSSFTIGVLDAVILCLFLAANVLLSIASQSIANFAILNLVPLYLGGRTNIQADYLGIPLPVYGFAHHWVARVFATQALLHSGLRFSHASGIGRLTGAVAAGLVIATLVTSILPIRRRHPTLFRWSHLLLALLILCGVGSHVVIVTSSFLSFPSILCFTAAGLLTIAWILRLGRRLYRGQADGVHYEVLEGAVRLWVRVRHSIPTRPGTYFYVRFPNLPLRARFQSHLLPVAFWRPTSQGSTKDISFLIPSSRDLRAYIRRGGKLSVCLDGPYGEQLSLGQYELIILVAEGEGIAGVLSLAQSILSRRKRDDEDKLRGLQSELYCDRTRKVDLIWRLQDNAQVKWASSHFASLSDMEVATTSQKTKKVARVSTQNQISGTRANISARAY